MSKTAALGSGTIIVGTLAILAVFFLPLTWPTEQLQYGASALSLIGSVLLGAGAAATASYGARNWPFKNRAPTSAEAANPAGSGWGQDDVAG